MSLRRFVAALGLKDPKPSHPSPINQNSTLSLPDSRGHSDLDSQVNSRTRSVDPPRQALYSSGSKSSSVSLPEQRSIQRPKIKFQKSFSRFSRGTSTPTSSTDYLPSQLGPARSRSSVFSLFQLATESVSSLFDDTAGIPTEDGTRSRWARWRGKNKTRQWDFLDRARSGSPSPLDHQDDDDSSSVSSDASFLQSVPTTQSEQERPPERIPSPIPAVYLPRSHTNLHALTLSSLNFRASPHPLFNLTSEPKFPRSSNAHKVLPKTPSLRINLAKTRVLDKLEAQQLTPSENESILPFGRRTLPKPQGDSESEELKRLCNDGGHSAGLSFWASRSPFLKRVVFWEMVGGIIECRSPFPPSYSSELRFSSGLRALAGLDQGKRVVVVSTDEDETIGGILPPLDRQDINEQLSSLISLPLLAPSVTPSNASTSPPQTPLIRPVSLELGDVQRVTSEPESISEYAELPITSTESLYTRESRMLDEPITKPAGGPITEPVAQTLSSQTLSLAETPPEVEDVFSKGTSPLRGSSIPSRNLRRIPADHNLNNSANVLQPRLSHVSSFWPPTSSRSPAPVATEVATPTTTTASPIAPAITPQSEASSPSPKLPNTRARMSTDEGRPVVRTLNSTFDTALPKPSDHSTGVSLLSTVSSRRLRPAKPSISRESAAPLSPQKTPRRQGGHSRFPSTSDSENLIQSPSPSTRKRSNSAPKSPSETISRIDLIYLSPPDGRVVRRIGSGTKLHSNQASSSSIASSNLSQQAGREHLSHSLSAVPPLPVDVWTYQPPVRRSEDSLRIKASRSLPLPTMSLPSFMDPRNSPQPKQSIQAWDDISDPSILYRPSISGRAHARRM